MGSSLSLASLQSLWSLRLFLPARAPGPDGTPHHDFFLVREIPGDPSTRNPVTPGKSSSYG